MLQTREIIIFKYLLSSILKYFITISIFTQIKSKDCIFEESNKFVCITYGWCPIYTSLITVSLSLVTYLKLPMFSNNGAKTLTQVLETTKALDRSIGKV